MRPGPFPSSTQSNQTGQTPNLPSTGSIAILPGGSPMRRQFSLAIAVVLASSTLALAQQPATSAPAAPAAQAQQPPPPPPPAVKVGEAAPDFTLPYRIPAADGRTEAKTAKLSDDKGKQNVVL